MTLLEYKQAVADRKIPDAIAATGSFLPTLPGTLLKNPFSVPADISVEVISKAFGSDTGMKISYILPGGAGVGASSTNLYVFLTVNYYKSGTSFSKIKPEKLILVAPSRREARLYKWNGGTPTLVSEWSILYKDPTTRDLVRAAERLEGLLTGSGNANTQYINGQQVIPGTLSYGGYEFNPSGQVISLKHKISYNREIGFTCPCGHPEVCLKKGDDAILLAEFMKSANVVKDIKYPLAGGYTSVVLQAQKHLESILLGVESDKVLIKLVLDDDYYLWLDNELMSGIPLVRDIEEAMKNTREWEQWNKYSIDYLISATEGSAQKLNLPCSNRSHSQVDTRKTNAAIERAALVAKDSHLNSNNLMIALTFSSIIYKRCLSCGEWLDLAKKDVPVY